MNKPEPVSAATDRLTQPLPQRVKLPLRLKITAPYLILSLVLAVGVSLLVNRIVFDTADERFKNQLIETAKISSELTVAQETQNLETLRLIANSQGVSEALTAGDAEKLRTLTLGIVVNARAEAVEFIHTNGQHVLSMRHIQGGNVEEYAFSQGGDNTIAGWDFVQKTMAAALDTQGDKYAGVVNVDWGKYLYVAGPIYDAGNNLAGLVLIGKSVPSMALEIRTQTLAQISFYTRGGDLLYSSLITPQALPAETAEFVLANQDASSLDRQLGARSLFSSNVDYEEILKPWEIRNGEDIGIIGMALPKNLFVRASLITRIQIFVVLLLAILMVIGLGNRLANSISRPVTHLVTAATRVSQGDLKVQIPITTQDEIAILAQSFNQMVQSVNLSQNNLVEAYNSTLLGWSKALELRDEETEGHTLRVTKLAVALGERLGIRGDPLENIRRGAILHDIGKMAVSDSILRKPGSLSVEERQIIEMHPQYAFEMLRDISFLRPALSIPYYHHERWDGSGYPKGLKGEQIPLAARIFSVIDVWDAMTNKRIYRDAISNAKVVEYIRQQSGLYFDPNIVEVFLGMIAEDQDLGDNA